MSDHPPKYLRRKSTHLDLMVSARLKKALLTLSPPLALVSKKRASFSLANSCSGGGELSGVDQEAKRARHEPVLCAGRQNDPLPSRFCSPDE